MGVYVTLQVALAVEPDRVHDVALNVPVLFVVKLTVPVGVVGVALVSVTVAVQVVGVLSKTLAKEQLTDVVVECSGVTPTPRVNVPVLPLWTESPG